MNVKNIFDNFKKHHLKNNKKDWIVFYIQIMKQFEEYSLMRQTR